uniref:SbsA Ig-like domain-containing protein n=1 Tax=Cyanothece sp. (strain PCC 7425 / ATCC 29141) TaxID=395961 RepID=B8HVA9_CYAP4
MRSPVWLILSLCLISGSFTPAGLAQNQSKPTSESLAQTLLAQEPSADQEGGILIPKSSAIAITFKFPVNFDPKGQKVNYPITVALAQPLRDSTGRIVAAKDALVNIYFRPLKDGVEIEAYSIVIAGRVIPIKTTPMVLPAVMDPERFGLEFVPSPGIFSNLADALVQWLAAAENINLATRTSLAAGLALTQGVALPRPKKAPPLVTIVEGNTFVLPLAEDVVLPESLPLTLDTPSSEGEGFAPEPPPAPPQPTPPSGP